MKKKLLILQNAFHFRSFSFFKYIFFKKRRRKIKSKATKYFYELPCIDFDEWASTQNKDLYLEMKKFQDEFVLFEKKFDFSHLGGSRGLDQFSALYFFTILLKPEFILETGVANGYSTFSFLSGIHQNKKGFLVSNDLPPLDIKKENWHYIGQMVPEQFKPKWKLFLGADKNNLKNITKNYDFDLAHFDSDKTKSGKMFCIETVIKNNSKHPLILIDNCADDFFWQGLKVENYSKFIFEQNKKRFGALIYKEHLSRLLLD